MQTNTAQLNTCIKINTRSVTLSVGGIAKNSPFNYRYTIVTLQQDLDRTNTYWTGSFHNLELRDHLLFKQQTFPSFSAMGEDEERSATHE